jgi:hypothetical protein
MSKTLGPIHRGPVSMVGTHSSRYTYLIVVRMMHNGSYS